MKTSKILSITIWAAKIFLSVSLLWAASRKLFQPAETLAQMWPWTAQNRSLVLVTGIIDAVAAIGILLPDLITLKSRLTLYTAYGVIILMIFASVFHISRGEAGQIGINISFLLVALFIIWTKKRCSHF